MCVIIAKDKGDRLPTIDELKNCFNNNDDGAGFMYTDGGKVVIDKGYMTEDDFIGHFKKLLKKYNNFNNKCLVIHCRIGTGGTNTAKNTHPYPISKDLKELHKTHTTATLGVAHNGVISNYNNLDDTEDTNDTQNFIRTYLFNLHYNYKRFYKDKKMLDAIGFLTNSKLAFLDNNDCLKLVGNFTNNNGLLFSNDSYIKRDYSLYNWSNWSSSDYLSSTNDGEASGINQWWIDKELQDYGELLDAGQWLEIDGGEAFKITSDDYYILNYYDYSLYTIDDNGDYVFLTNDFIIYDKNKTPLSIM